MRLNLLKFIKKVAQFASKLFPNFAKGATKLFQGAKGLASKGMAKVGGFAAKIFGKVCRSYLTCI